MNRYIGVDGAKFTADEIQKLDQFSGWTIWKSIEYDTVFRGCHTTWNANSRIMARDVDEFIAYMKISDTGDDLATTLLNLGSRSKY